MSEINLNGGIEVTIYGYNGRSLRVNLTNGSMSVETNDEVWYRTYFGGTNIIAYHLLKELPAHIDPLGPENILIFTTGPNTAVPLLGGGRNSLGAKSPQTGGFGYAEAGGFWGAEFKRTGFDTLIIEGKADKPVYLSIVDDKVEIRDASHLWGRMTREVEEEIKDELEDKATRVAQIGIAGENMVLYASAVNDLSHFYGRTGMGAVMGSKNLRAVAVRGHGTVPVANKDELSRLRKFMSENYKKLTGSLQQDGTAGNVVAYAGTTGLPTKNWTGNYFENAEKISGQTMTETMLVHRGTCFACPITCKREVEVGEPWNVDPKYGGPEYETVGAFGSNLCIDNLEAIAKANELCNSYCMDTISTGGTIAFAMECFEEGLLSLSDTDGIELRFGNVQAMIETIHKIAHREGIGDLLADGTRKAAEKIGRGSELFAVQNKGQELAMHEPRAKFGLGLGYAVNVTGGCHSQNFHDNLYSVSTEEIRPFGILEPLPVDDLGPGKIRMMIPTIHWRHVRHCIDMCSFIPWNKIQIPELVAAITGWDTSLYEVDKVGERAVVLSRMFNYREGFTEKDDQLPLRIFEPTRDGPIAGQAPTRENFERAKRMFYEMSGWDPDTGEPKEWKLYELNLGWVIDVMKAA